MRTLFASLTAATAFLGLMAAAQATVHIEVDLASQSMHVSSHHGEYDWAVSTGRPGHRTPTGFYRPQRMYLMTYSRKYEDAPMPHAIFFTGGYAIHATYQTAALGSVASHGCIRLSPGHAATLYDMVKHEGATIEISGQAPGRDEDVVEREPRHAVHRLAARYLEEDDDYGYTPHYGHHARPLPYWVDDPLENQ
jgi:hypothetical protein